MPALIAGLSSCSRPESSAAINHPKENVYQLAVRRAEELKSRVRIDPTLPHGPRGWPVSGWIDIQGDGRLSRFDESADGLGFWSERTLVIASPGKSPVELYMYWDGVDTYEPPYLQWSKNADDPDLAPQREFLETIRYAYGYITEEDILSQPDNPEYADHFWGNDNGPLQEGFLTLRWYKGKPCESLMESILLQDGPRVFTKCGRGRLHLYDSDKDTWCLLYHADSRYNGPNVLTKADPWLLIGAWGEGVIAVDLSDQYYIRLGPPESIGKLEVRDSKILIDDGRRTLDWPIRRTGLRTRSYFFRPGSPK